MKAAPRNRTPRARLGPEALWELALRALAGRALSSGELKRRLLARAASAGDVDSTLTRLRQAGYLDDKRFADDFAGARLENQGLGRARVLRDLRQRQVSPALAERAVTRAYQETDEIALIEAYVERKILRARSGAALADPKELASAWRKLVRAGFSSGNILRVLKRIARDPEVVDSFEPPAESDEEP